MQQHYYKFWRELIKPKGFEIDRESQRDDYAKFIIRPLERGFGVTIGNSLRRILLSSMMGSAVSAVKFEGVLHEFTTIPDVLEDVTDIILNLKEVRFRHYTPDALTLKISKNGPGKVTALCGRRNELGGCVPPAHACAGGAPHQSHVGSTAERSQC